ncbi:hypothetical protein OESDEN_15388, partial [Oesophagostomum dentatum]
MNQTRQIRQNVVTFENEERRNEDPEDETAVNLVRKQKPHKEGVLLLTGSSTVQGPHSSKQVRILLDTGSELSFIHSKLVDEMQLPIQGISSLNIKTFGTDHAKEQNHRLVTVCLVDIQGQEHKFQLYDSPFITSHSKAPTLSQEDIRFIKSNKINLCRLPDSDEQPQILLGCDYLWDLLEGLHLISTKFGHMISGQKTPKEQALKSEEVLKIESERNDNEADVWDKYWTIESTGINEYTGTEKSEKELVDEKIINKFKETIVKRPDGYYVRLPWKDEKTPLPDNKNMALARLRSLFRQYRNRKEDLLEIDDIFKTQLEQRIIEPVRETIIPLINEKVHYLPYQVVVTPEKKTTPKRIVFDASAHSVGKPSLNDLLYQGPLILPNIVGILMRFRTGKVATIADIEKAFLQVRLNEQDRNVTRFLWVKDVNKPLDDLNIQIYRFTRVTFGLNASPFLLAATIDYHLDTTVKNEKVANQIKANMYVDNLLLTSETTQEAFEQYKIAKTIFSVPKLEMNALTIAARLSPSAYEELKDTIHITTVYLLTDSEIVLGWLKNANESKTTGVLVTNRVKEIKRITQQFTDQGVHVYFGYVSTTVNPADCATRGLTASELENHIWWSGPEFSRRNHHLWPEETRLFELPQIRTAEILQISKQNITESLFDYTRFRSMLALKRTAATTLRFVSKCSRNLSQQTKTKLSNFLVSQTAGSGTISAQDVRKGEILILKDHQKRFQDSIYSSLQRKLNVKYDEYGVLRCYGRLGKSYLNEEAKRPALIAPNTKLATLIIREAHGTFHRSTAHTMCE